MSIEIVVFDVGETLIDETRLRARLAQVLDVPMPVLLSTLRQVIERREHHMRVIEILRPDIGRDAFRERVRALAPAPFDASDLFPDAVASLVELKHRGYRIGIVGNQPAAAEQALTGLELAVDFIATSAGWGVEKPAAAFFARVAEAATAPPSHIAYVGDRIDNDVLPAQAAGMLGVFLKRRPWADVHARWPEAAQAAITLDDLASLPDALERFR
jgi:HAD superfamily hydrolase (TIGR01549 family)